MKSNLDRAVTLIGVLFFVTFAGATKAHSQGAPSPLITQRSLTAIPSMPGPAIGEQFTELSSGIFTYSKTDLSLPGPMPINITRVYRSTDQTSGSGWNNRAFGLGTRLNYDLFVYYLNGSANVSMPDSSTLSCSSTGPPYTCNSQPSGAWFGSVLDASSNLTRPDGTEYSFDPTTGLLLSIKDRYSNIITISRGPSVENTACHTQSGGGSVPSAYTGTVSSSNGRAVYFCYDDPNNPTDITGIADNATGGPIKKVTYTYGVSGYLNTVTQPNGSQAVTTYQYNQGTPNAGQGNITTIIVNDACPNNTCGSPNQVFTYITYVANALGTAVKSISSQLPGNGYTYNYNSPGGYPAEHVTVTLPDNATRDFYFDPAGYLTTDVRNANAANPEYTDFLRGQQTVGTSREFVGVVEEGDPIQRGTTYNYDTSAGTVKSVALSPAPGQSSCCATSAMWNYTYDSLNRLTNAVEPLDYNGVGTKYVYTGNQSMTVTDQLGRVTTVEYNAQGQPISVQDPIGNPATQIQYYSPSGDLKSITDPAGNTTTYVTDADGRVTSVTSPLQEKTQYSYDAIDDVTEVIDPMNNITCNTYDLLGELASTTPPKGVSGGCNAGQVSSAFTTTVTRNASLSKTTVTDPLGYTTVTDLDGQGRHSDYTDKRGVETTYAYNKFGEVTEAFFDANSKSGFSQEKVDMSNFDVLDRVGKITDSLLGNTDTFTYDSLDSILSTSDTGGSALSVSYTYDSNGRRTVMAPSLQASVKYGYDCADELVGISNNGTWTPPSCGPSTWVNYTGNISTSAQVAFNLDMDSNAAEMLVDGVDTLITARDADERIKAENFKAYSSPYTSYGGLTYTYDPDGHVTDTGGTLAAINFPPAASASYSTTDQITMWNAAPTNPDHASNITADPNGLSFVWNARNQLSTISGGVAALFSYDGLGRREISNATPPGALQYFEYDGSSMIGWNTAGSNPSYNFLSTPGGAAMAGSFTSGGTTTTWVPLIDASGSTLGLVNAASTQSGPATTYTYDPSGNPTVSGSANEWPFQYRGMEKQFTDPGPYYYSDGGQYYSSQFVRSLSEAGQTSSSGPGGPPPSQLPYGPGSQGNGSFGQWYVGQLNPFGRPNLGGLPDVNVTVGEASYVVPVGAIAQAIEELVSFFDWLSGGSSAPPTPRQLLHARHPLYPVILGIEDGLIPDEASAAQGSADPMTISGEASFYYPTGHTGCSNYVYSDPEGFTAAMSPKIVGPNGTFPCGTEANVTYLKPGSKAPKTITVKVIDHGPYAKGKNRIIDLSPGAFKALTGGSLSEGHIPVTVTLPAGPQPPLQ